MKKFGRKFGSVILSLVMVMTLGASVALGADFSRYEKQKSPDEMKVVIEGRYIYEDNAKVLKEINRIRKEACREHLIIPDYPNGLKESDYTPIKWSYELETIAKIRAAECNIFTEHVRPNGLSCFSLPSENGASSFGENLSWSTRTYYGAGILLDAVENFYKEKSYVKKGTRNFYDDIIISEDMPEDEPFQLGHYLAMINPKNEYTGMAGFVNADDNIYFASSCAMEFSLGPAKSDSESEYLHYGLVDKDDIKLVQNEGRAITRTHNESVTVPFDPNLNGIRDCKFYIDGGGIVKAGQSKQLKVNSLSYKYINLSGYEDKVELKVKNASPKWTSGNNNIATVNSDGVVTGKSQGNNTVTISASLGKFKGTTTIGPGKWKKSNGKWYYSYGSSYAKNETIEINGDTYAFDSSGYIKTGWIYNNGAWHYHNKRGEGTEGAMVKNTWKKIDGKWYYFYKDGKMAANTTIGGWYVNSSGAWTVDSWKTSGGRYWYAYKDGGYAKNEFVQISGNKYAFDGKGWMRTGWFKVGDNWYYANKKGQGVEGAMATNSWKKINGKWYYFYEDGKMAANTTIGSWYVNKSGAWTVDSWKKSGGRYWYSYKDGGYPHSEFKAINGNTYYFDVKGWMKTGWFKVGDNWYYANQKGQGVEGAIATNSWKKIGGKWYYFYEDGKMAANTTIGSWYVNKSGAWTVDSWKTSKGRYWYAYKEGGYPHSELKVINGNTYYFDESGWMKTGWLKVDEGWHYFNKKGEGVEGAMIINGCKKISGKDYCFKDGIWTA